MSNTEFKHTRRPWHVEHWGTKNPDSKRWKVKILKWVGKKLIATVWGDSKEEAEANAKLIAASPELLEALIEAKRTIKALHGDAAWDIYDAQSPEMRKINSAISKATN